MARIIELLKPDCQEFHIDITAGAMFYINMIFDEYYKVNSQEFGVDESLNVNVLPNVLCITTADEHLKTNTVNISKLTEDEYVNKREGDK